MEGTPKETKKKKTKSSKSKAKKPKSKSKSSDEDVPGSPDGSNSQMNVLRSSKRNVKSGACEACYLKKVKCDLAANQEAGRASCSRCAKKKQTCIPRYRRRGRPTAISAGNGAVRFPTFRTVQGWRCCEAFLAQPGSEAQYAAAGNLVAALKKQGSTDPLWLKWAIKLMMQMAIADKSMGLLHAATTLAVSAGIKVDTEVMRIPPKTQQQKHSMLTPGMVRQLELSVSDPTVPIDKQKPRAAGYLFKAEYGIRTVEPDPFFEYLFLQNDQIKHMIKQNPGLTKFWHAPINDPQDIKIFVSLWMNDVICNRINYSEDSMINEYRLPDVKIHDRFNNVYSCTLEQVTHFSDTGARYWQSFSFTDLKLIPGERFEENTISEEVPAVDLEVIVARKRNASEMHEQTSSSMTSASTDQELNFFDDVQDESEQLRKDVETYKRERLGRRASLPGHRQLGSSVMEGPIIGGNPDIQDESLLEIDIFAWPDELLSPNSARVTETFDQIIGSLDP